MGLTEPTGPNTWRLRRDFERVLRAMQRTSDRQRTLAAHGVLMSDERLPIEVLDLRQITSVEGRVLVHGQDEQTGRNYLMLEGTDAKVHFIQYAPEMEEARSRGELRVSFRAVAKAIGKGAFGSQRFGRRRETTERHPPSPRNYGRSPQARDDADRRWLGRLAGQVSSCYPGDCHSEGMAESTRPDALSRALPRPITFQGLAGMPSGDSPAM